MAFDKTLYNRQRRAKAFRYIAIVSQYIFNFIRYAPLYFKYRQYTMIGLRAYLENLAFIAIALKDKRLEQGSLIECGTWRGGMAAGMIEVGGPDRVYHFFDSFEGLPPPQDIDGAAAKLTQAEDNVTERYGKCIASREEFEATLRLTNCPANRISIHEGFFEKTFPPSARRPSPCCGWTRTGMPQPPSAWKNSGTASCLAALS